MDEVKWYENGTLESIKNIIKDNVNVASRSFVTIGYYLKNVRDRGLYEVDGYQDIWEFAQVEFGIGKSSASSFMSINDRFSVDGNSPILLEQYKDFTSSKLSEMLNLSDEQLGQIKPETTIVEIRKIKKPKQKETVLTSEQEPAQSIDDLELSVRTFNCLKRAGIDTIDELCSMTEDDLVKVRNFSLKCLNEVKEKLSEIERCLKQETEKEEPLQDNLSRITEDEFILAFYGHLYDEEKQIARDRKSEQLREELITNHGKTHERGNGILQWRGWFSCYPDKVVFRQNGIDKQIQLSWGKYVSRLLKLLDTAFNMPEIKEAAVIEQEKSEIIEVDIIQSGPEEEPDSLSLAKEILKKKQDSLRDWINVTKDNRTPSDTKNINKLQIEIGALAAYISDLDNTVNPVPEPVQPELPVLKNNDQRKEWIDGYASWPVWIDQPLTGERYYRYDFEDGTSFVVRVSLRHGYKGYERIEDIDYGHEEYFLLGVKDKWIPGMPTFVEASTSKSVMVEHLKGIQKKG